MNATVPQVVSTFDADCREIASETYHSRKTSSAFPLWYEHSNEEPLYPKVDRLFVRVRDSSAFPGGSLVALWKDQLLESQTATGNQISNLQKFYVLTDPDELADFLKRHRALAGLLVEMKTHLQSFFGEDSIWILGIDKPEGESPVATLSTRWKDSAEDAASALRAFDDNYWIDNCSRSSGNVVVTYDLV